MDRLNITANGPLNGEIVISGAKNSALPIMCSSLLTKENLSLANIPVLSDIKILQHILQEMGAKIIRNNINEFKINCGNINKFLAPYELVRKVRISILILGPTLARFGEAKVNMPGGCAIGSRPIDQHIKGLELMGAVIKVEQGYISAKAKRLCGAKIVMDMVTVTGTENLLMAATLAKGITVLENAAIEPEVTDLAECLIKMGAKIHGIGTSCLVIEGVDSLHGASHSVIPDRIEAGTFLCAVAMTKGKVTLKNVLPHTMIAILNKISEAGAHLEIGDNWITIEMKNNLKPVNITTQPYPGIPTDLQAQFMAMNSIAKGLSVITENIFENRFMHVPELNRMGANIIIDGNTAMIRGVNHLSGGIVKSTDLRASASLVISGLIAKGETIVEEIYHLDRGYENLEKKLCNVGANIRRIKLY